MDKKLKDKKKAVEDARKIQAQMERARDKAGPPGSPFAKFFGSMADLLGDLADQTEQELMGAVPVSELPFSEDDDEIVIEEDDEMMEDEEDV